MEQQAEDRSEDQTDGQTAIVRNRKGQFVPGVSGNPSGRPRGTTLLTKALTELGQGYFAEEIEKAKAEGRDPRTRNEVLAEVLFKKAVKGDVRAAEVIFSRLEGKPKAHLKVEGEVKHEGKVDHEHQRAKTDVLDHMKRLKSNHEANAARLKEAGEVSEDVVDAEYEIVE